MEQQPQENQKAEAIEAIESRGLQIDEMVSLIIKDTTTELDNYLTTVRNCFLSNKEICDDDLDKIVLQIPVYLYPLIVLAQQIEIRKGIAKEQATYTKNEAILNGVGTVADKAARAENMTAKDRMTQLAYATASTVIQKKIDGAMTILDSTKKVQQRRSKEKALTMTAGASVGAF